MSMIATVREFFKDVGVESRKVSWPTRNELRDSTIVVIMTVILLTAFVYVVDWILRVALNLILR